MSAAYLNGPSVATIKERSPWCFGKVRFDSATIAILVVNRRKRRRDAQQSNAYYCRTCGGYHVGRADKDNVPASMAVRRELVRA